MLFFFVSSSFSIPTTHGTLFLAHQALRSLLFDSGHHAGAANVDRRTALHIGAAEGAMGVVHFLVEEACAPVLAKDRWGHTPLDDAKANGHGEVRSGPSSFRAGIVYIYIYTHTHTHIYIYIYTYTSIYLSSHLSIFL